MIDEAELNRQYDVYAAAREEYRKKIAEQAEEIERLRAALLTGVLMLSEMGLDPREKCQMAYDYMSAALEGE